MKAQAKAAEKAEAEATALMEKAPPPRRRR